MICNNFWCPHCETVKEYWYRYSESDLLACDGCSKSELVVKLSAPSFAMAQNSEELTKTLRKRALDDDKKHFRERKKVAYEKAKI